MRGQEVPTKARGRSGEKAIVAQKLKSNHCKDKLADVRVTKIRKSKILVMKENLKSGNLELRHQRIGKNLFEMNRFGQEQNSVDTPEY